MGLSSFNTAHITGILQVVPANEKCIDDESALYGNNAKQIERIKKAIGLNKRRIAPDGVTSGDMCFEAADRLISGMKIDKNTIDGLIMVTQTPDHSQPATAAILHGRLGLSNNCAAFDVNLGCSGYVYGLWLAHMMVESGGCTNVLLLAGDTLSRVANPRDRSTAPLFGDAGSATLISHDPAASSSSYFSLHTDGTGSDTIKVPAGGFRKPHSAETAIEHTDDDGNVRSEENLWMQGGDVFNFSLDVEPKAIREILEFSKRDIDSIDYVVFHQANKYIISNIVRKLKLPMDKAPCETVSKYGNQSSASIPGTITDALSEQVQTSHNTLILSGFGVGLSWGTCIVPMNNIWCPEPVSLTF